MFQSTAILSTSYWTISPRYVLLAWRLVFATHYRPDLTCTMQQASDCDMVLAHDDDLVTIDGLGHDTVSGLLNSCYIVSSCWQSLETLESDVMMGLLRRSNVEIHKVLCGETPQP
jgi:hypothetical protein